MESQCVSSDTRSRVDLWTRSPDEATCARIRSGDPATFEQMVEELDPALERRLMRNLRYSYERREVRARSWGRLFLKRFTLRGSGSVANWVFAIARRELLGFIRERRRSRAIQLSDASEGWLQASLDDCDVFQRRDWEVLVPVLRAEIEDLSRRQAVVLHGRIHEQLPFGVIAARLGIRPSTARATFRDAVRKLRSRVSLQLSRLPERTDYTKSSERHQSAYEDWHDAFFADAAGRPILRRARVVHCESE
jgi:RNA polymerase sigma factor (sigma-70 family)